MLAGEFFRVLQSMGVLLERQASFYLMNVLAALHYLHNQDILFRDLKPENLVMDEFGYLKLVDLGFAKQVSTGLTYTFCGTPEYMAPEIVTRRGSHKAADFW